MLAPDGATETDVSVLGGGGLLERPPPHPVLAIMRERNRKKTEMERNQRKRMANCLILREM
jgi:hypothetical protein